MKTFEERESIVDQVLFDELKALQELIDKIIELEDFGRLPNAMIGAIDCARSRIYDIENELK